MKRLAMIDLILARRNMLRDLYHMKTVKGMGLRMTNYMVVLCKLKSIMSKINML